MRDPHPEAPPPPLPPPFSSSSSSASRCSGHMKLLANAFPSPPDACNSYRRVHHYDVGIDRIGYLIGALADAGGCRPGSASSWKSVGSVLGLPGPTTHPTCCAIVPQQAPEIVGGRGSPSSPDDLVPQRCLCGALLVSPRCLFCFPKRAASGGRLFLLGHVPGLMEQRSPPTVQRGLPLVLQRPESMR